MAAFRSWSPKFQSSHFEYIYIQIQTLMRALLSLLYVPSVLFDREEPE